MPCLCNNNKKRYETQQKDKTDWDWKKNGYFAGGYQGGEAALQDTAFRPAKEWNQPFDTIFNYFTYKNQVPTTKWQCVVFIRVVTQHWHTFNS